MCFMSLPRTLSWAQAGGNLFLNVKILKRIEFLDFIVGNKVTAQAAIRINADVNSIIENRAANKIRMPAVKSNNYRKVFRIGCVIIII